MVTISFGSLFHSVIVLGKKENLKISLCPFGTINLKQWLPSVLFLSLQPSSPPISQRVNHSTSLFYFNFQKKKKHACPDLNCHPLSVIFATLATFLGSSSAISFSRKV